MTQSTRNTIGSSLARTDVRLVFVFLSLFAFVFPEDARSGEQTGPFLLSSPTQTARDIAIEAKVRRALRQDTKLKSLNLGVNLRGGIASLSGPLPTADLKQRAIKIVQQVEGVLSVSAKDLYVSTAIQGTKRVSVVIPNDRPTQTRSASPGLVSTGLEPPDCRPSSTASGQQVTLLAPEMAITPSRAPEPARLTANPHPVSPSVAIASAIEQLRQREPRFQQLRARVQDTTVYVLGGDPASGDVMLFAQSLRRLPGVQHVVISSGSR